MKRKFIVVSVIAVIGMYMISFTGARPANLGTVNGQLRPLPNSPNCVSTQTDDTSRKMSPLTLSKPKSEMLDQIADTIASFPRAEVVNRTDDYLHAEFRSLIFRFVDDVEFYVDENNGVVHFRSGSRVGHSDLGANRKRMTTLISRLQRE